MSTVSGNQQAKRSQASRVGSSVTTRSTTNATSTTQPTRASSIAAMPSSAQFSRNSSAGTGCNCGAAGQGKKLSAEVWDPFQFDCVSPECKVSSKDLLHAMNQQRRGQSHGTAACRPPPPSRNYCDSGESDSTVSENGRRTIEFLYDMWCQQKLCDVVIRCCCDGNTDDTILAHKVPD